MKASAVNEDAPAAVADETGEPPEQGRSDGGNLDGDNSTRPLATSNHPLAQTIDSPSAPSTQSSAPAQPAEPASLPVQVAREQIASGQPLETVPKPRGKGQRVVGAARDAVGERLAPRVEKIRQASTVVWTEAQDDPNLRFILVAIFLFILAIVIILLGTYLR
jgi:hypothetical protein